MQERLLVVEACLDHKHFHRPAGLQVANAQEIMIVLLHTSQGRVHATSVPSTDALAAFEQIGAPGSTSRRP